MRDCRQRRRQKPQIQEHGENMSLLPEHRISIIELPASPQNSLESAARVALQAKVRRDSRDLNKALRKRTVGVMNPTIIERKVMVFSEKEADDNCWQLIQHINRNELPIACNGCKHVDVRATYTKYSTGEVAIRGVITCKSVDPICPDGYLPDKGKWRFPKIYPDYIRTGKHRENYSFVYIDESGVEVPDTYIFTNEDLKVDGFIMSDIVPGQMGRQINPSYFDEREQVLLEELAFQALNQRGRPETPTDNAW